MALAYTRLGKSHHKEIECDGEHSHPAITPIAAANPKTTPPGPRIKDDIADAVHFLEGVLRDLTALVTEQSKQTENVALRPYVDERLAGLVAIHQTFEARLVNCLKTYGDVDSRVAGALAAIADHAAKIEAICRDVKDNHGEVFDALVAFKEQFEAIEKNHGADLDKLTRLAKGVDAACVYQSTRLTDLAKDVGIKVAKLEAQMQSRLWYVNEQMQLHYSRIGTLNEQLATTTNAHNKLADVVENLKDRQGSLLKSHAKYAGIAEKCESDNAWIIAKQNTHTTMLADLRVQIDTLRQQVEALVQERRLSRRPLWKRISAALMRR